MVAATFTVDSVSYPSAEHWMMAGKARLFGDSEGLAAVLCAASPSMTATNADVERPSAWRGLNLLGFALMEVRERL